MKRDDRGFFGVRDKVTNIELLIHDAGKVRVGRSVINHQFFAIHIAQGNGQHKSE